MGLIVLPKAVIVHRMERQANAPTVLSNSAPVSLPEAEPDEDPPASATPIRDITNTNEPRLRGSQQYRSNRGPRMQFVTFD